MAWQNNRPNHVPTRVREQALDRDGHRCTAVMQNGQRCPETTNLEAAHLGQWQPGEHTTVDMVRTLCHWHHNRETQQQAATARTQATHTKPSPTRPPEQHPAFR